MFTVQNKASINENMQKMENTKLKTMYVTL